jgi:hypothetical protein
MAAGATAAPTAAARQLLLGHPRPWCCFLAVPGLLKKRLSFSGSRKGLCAILLLVSTAAQWKCPHPELDQLKIGDYVRVRYHPKRDVGANWRGAIGRFMCHNSSYPNTASGSYPIIACFEGDLPPGDGDMMNYLGAWHTTGGINKNHNLDDDSDDKQNTASNPRMDFRACNDSVFDLVQCDTRSVFAFRCDSIEPVPKKQQYYLMSPDIMTPKMNFNSAQNSYLSSCEPMVDVNGDGLPDIVCNYQKDANAKRYYVGINTGCGWVNSIHFHEKPEGGWCPPSENELDQQVMAFLQKHGLAHYQNQFAYHEIVFMDLYDLSDAELRELGIKTIGGRKKFRRAVAATSKR